MQPRHSAVTSTPGSDQTTPLLPRYESSEFFNWFDPSLIVKDFYRAEDVFADSLGDSWILFEVFNRSSPRYWDSPIQLAIGVCGDAESDHKNCSEACSRQSDMFDSWDLIRHCLTLASLSLAAESFSGLEESSIDLVNDALHHFSVQDATEFPGELILNQTFECALASCQTDAGECRMKELNSSYIVDGRVHWNVMADSLAEMCEGIEVNVNSDVAGPGVLISYFVQMGMALYAWAFIVLPKIFNAMAAFTRFLGRILHSFGFKRRIIVNRPSISKRLEKTNLAHATSTFLVEFHEAQCFFVISIEIALLYSASRSSSSGSTNRAALIVFSDLLSIFACIGAWPILLTQASLRRSRLDSFYYLTLSTVAMALAFATSNKAVYPDFDESRKLFAGQNIISECGNNTSLRSFCLTSSNTGRPTKIWTSGLGVRYFFLLLISLFWFPKLLGLGAKITWLRKKPKAATEQQRKATCLARGVLVGIAIVFFLATDGIAMVFIVYSLYDLHNLRLELDLGDWGVGQVIAVLVWAPVISKYLYLVMFGVEKGFVYRLSRAFMVVKNPIEIESDDEEDTAPVARLGVAPDGTPLMPVHRNMAGW